VGRCEKSGNAYFKVLFQHLPGRTKGNHEKLYSLDSVSAPEFKLGLPTFKTGVLTTDHYKCTKTNQETEKH
jgi:hypothetical protein